MFRIAICDEDSLSTENIIACIQAMPSPFDIPEISVFADLRSLLVKCTSNTRYELIILDPANVFRDNLEAGRVLRELDKTVPIMFTSKDKNCFSGKKTLPNQQYFLPKPVIPEVLYKLLDNLMRNTLYDQHYRFPMVCEESRFDLGIDKILYVEAKGPQVLVHTRKKSYPKSATMKSMERWLCRHQFVRIHKSFLVNVHQIETFKRYKAVLKNKVELDISKNRYKEIADKIEALLRP